MTVLSREDRGALDTAVQAARRVAEAGARNALSVLGICDEKKPPHLTLEQAELRRLLRVELRRLGGVNAEGFEALIRAVAYEQWHRMLFARFLAENDLLFHPTYKVAVTLAECGEIAREENRDLFELAAEYAEWMLPGIFRQDDPLLSIRYAPEDTAGLHSILSGISDLTFLAEDALGWTYQFWQTEKKKEVNVSERKIEGYDLCAVTQLFTEPYMVQFLLENTLGAWWLSLHPESRLRSEWVYYKEQVQHDFSTWPTAINDLRILDPCCGSGHFLVRAFHMLLAMRQELGEDDESAIAAIIGKNLHGLELDPRCIQIATFALALEAWKAGFSPTKSYLPVPNLACTGIPIKAEKEEWLRLAGGDGSLEIELEKYYELFKNADTLGSLIQVDSGETLANAETLKKAFERAIKKEKDAGDPVAAIFGETAHGVMKAVDLLSRKYDCVVTNVPYLSGGKHGSLLKSFCQDNYSDAKNDIATVFLKRCLSLCRRGGKVSAVMPQNWLFLKSYMKFREGLLKQERWDLLARLGEGGFHSSAAAGAFTILLSISHTQAPEGHMLCGLDVSEERSAAAKAGALVDAEMKCVEQKGQLENPDGRIVFEMNTNETLLSTISYCYHGLTSGDMPRMKFCYWEITELMDIWMPYQGTISNHIFFGGNECLLRWEHGNGAIRILPGARRDGLEAWGKQGVLISQMRVLPSTIFKKEAYDNNTAVIVPHNPAHLPAIWCFCSSPEYNTAVRKIDQSLKVTNATLVKVPFDIDHWTKVAEEQYPHGLPEPYSDDPTQWLFHGHPCGSVIWDEETKRLTHGPIRTDATVLHVAIARLLGYRWPAETDPGMELAAEAREWVKRCDALLPFADDDGIAGIPSLRGEGRLVDRLRSLLAAAYGTAWSPEMENKLLRAAGYTKNDGQLKGDLESLLRDGFFASHSQLFHHRPFIWQIWDGRPDGFSVLLNYHKLDRRNLERLIYTYLGGWITQQRSEVAAGNPGSEERLVAALDLKGRLEKILEGEKPYDIFIRWKPIHEQPIGWDPDLNDGIRLNIRPFVEAGVLRSTPKIHWRTDRGKDPVPNASGTMERHNDRHFKIDEKKQARVDWDL
ncbi:hypothetical protein RJ53_02735 [Methanocalculus chunghsingensis]|uniref:site-specific DNA-methyltransferase (adenine-specific) n=1 Tax=Methanocalculus chunghsingensis TaxID=156457 RepID=A0A8J7W580_9EURY|nr:DNA methyltransferase [Methanocalculus chunghsingensis]MBR1368476.1 hypothetical protein [Methanocalculus chunghsingensis]